MEKKRKLRNLKEDEEDEGYSSGTSVQYSICSNKDIQIRNKTYILKRRIKSLQFLPLKRIRKHNQRYIIILFIQIRTFKLGTRLIFSKEE
jgi:hypothetical protein